MACHPEKKSAEICSLERKPTDVKEPCTQRCRVGNQREKYTNLDCSLPKCLILLEYHINIFLLRDFEESGALNV